MKTKISRSFLRAMKIFKDKHQINLKNIKFKVKCNFIIYSLYIEEGKNIEIKLIKCLRFVTNLKWFSIFFFIIKAWQKFEKYKNSNRDQNFSFKFFKSNAHLGEGDKYDVTDELSDLKWVFVLNFDFIRSYRNHIFLFCLRR